MAKSALKTTNNNEGMVPLTSLTPIPDKNKFSRFHEGITLAKRQRICNYHPYNGSSTESYITHTNGIEYILFC